jgi:hypothetical protein
MYVVRQRVTETAGVICTAYGNERLKRVMKTLTKNNVSYMLVIPFQGDNGIHCLPIHSAGGKPTAIAY